MDAKKRFITRIYKASLNGINYITVEMCASMRQATTTRPQNHWPNWRKTKIAMCDTMQQATQIHQKNNKINKI